MTAHRMAKTRKMTPLKTIPSSSMNSSTDSASQPSAMTGQPIRQALWDVSLFIADCVRFTSDARGHHLTTTNIITFSIDCSEIISFNTLGVLHKLLSSSRLNILGSDKNPTLKHVNHYQSARYAKRQNGRLCGNYCFAMFSRISVSAWMFFIL